MVFCRFFHDPDSGLAGVLVAVVPIEFGAHQENHAI